eukprot:gnl/MRDRNA2_/MRDRNA2_155652_c0_seq1.p1 gnl/MRDRNA2_/MRDRNA2_155652_c0~~gnl/MRDRNA2_/MRDRNA2_155652_c0_seq1.p1  ORF type:complete len:133 (-),score=13.97 gnl/MRDRNA2_/MRDRNA2_155652_c0_seq1:8-379(-)
MSALVTENVPKSGRQDSSKALQLEEVCAIAAQGDVRAAKALSHIQRLAPEKHAVATWAMLHRMANIYSRDQYIDPATGYSVFTSNFLKKQKCCGYSCRHCPHGCAAPVPGSSTNQPTKDIEDL